MSDRLASGSARLDAILDGGLLVNGINLIMGRPGSGKTILAQQYLFHNATAERPALYLSTVSEPLEKILHYGQSLSFFDNGVVGSRCAAQTIGLLLPSAAAHATAASRSCWAGGRVTRATTRKVLLPPAGMPANEATCPLAAVPWGLAERNSRPADKVCVILRCGAPRVPPSRTLTT